jgi:hypothetical protein
MTSIADSAVIIQLSSRSVPSPPSWFGEVALIVEHLRKQGVLTAINERVRFARRRFGHYDVIDFVAVLFGYAISGERTLQAFYERLHPFAIPFMALFGRHHLPARATLSRFLAALTKPATEALRTLFLADLLARPLSNEREIGGLVDRGSKERIVFDIDGTREAARQRALPKTEDRPAPQRRLGEVCAPGYTGRKRGEVVRTRTTVSQAHTSQWLGSFGNPGNGQYREELRRAVGVIQLYSKAHNLPEEQVVLRLDGQYGTGATLADLAGFSFVTRGKDYTVLDRAEIQSRLHLPADQQFSRPESDLVRTLYDYPDVAVGPNEQRCRVVVATHPASEKKSRVGLTRSGLVYELFFTNLPQDAFMASDVVALYLHRGAFEPILADEDVEQDPDRWCSHSPCGQEAWQIISQWVWNLRLELGHQLEPTPRRTTEFAPAVKEQPALSSGYGPPTIAAPWKAGRLSGRDFVLQPDGTLRCPAKQALSATERRREADGSLRLVYAAKMSQCRPCPLREQCQWHGRATTKPRRVSLLLHPLQVGTAPLLWKDWSRRQHRRACMSLLRHQRVEITLPQATLAQPHSPEAILSRAQRAHYRLSWEERLLRNARAPTTDRPTIKLFGVPEPFATFLGLSTV